MDDLRAERADGDGMQELKEFLAEKTHCPLLAWLSAFDKNGDGHIDVDEFKKAMEQLKYPGDVQELFRVVDADSSGYLTMSEIDAWSCDLWAAFRRWCGQTFSSAEDMVAKLSQEICGHGRMINGRKVSLQAAREASFNPPGTPWDAPRGFNEAQFVRNAVRLGWYGSFEPVLFKCLDKDALGRVTAVNLAWLEQEHHLHLKRSKTKTKCGIRDMAKAARSLQSFLAFLRMKFGCPYRGWRCALDKQGSMVVHRRELLKACNELGWHGDVSALWHAMDPEDTGCSSLEEFSATEARALALFGRWAVDFHGSVKAGFRSLLLANRHKHKSKGKLDREGWLAACEWERATFDPTWVFNLLDWEQSGLISFKEVKFLEAWTPAEWLSADPDAKAAEDFKRQLLDRCEHYVKAWRLLIDTDSSGKVTFKEFKRAADAVEFRGDTAGAFLALDTHGFCELTLNEIDSSAAKSLSEFRRWAYSEFGGVMLAFKALDTDGSGALSWREFRQAFNRHRFKGDIWILFSSLNVNGDNTIDKSEVSFLDDWEIDMLQHHADPSHGQSDIRRATVKRRESLAERMRSPGGPQRYRAEAGRLRESKEAEDFTPENSMSGAKLLQLIGWSSEGRGIVKPSLNLTAVAPEPAKQRNTSPLPVGFLPPATPRSQSRRQSRVGRDVTEDSSTPSSWPSTPSPPATARMAWAALASTDTPRATWAPGATSVQAALAALRATPSGLSGSSYRSSPAARRANTVFGFSGAKTPRSPSSRRRSGHLTLTLDQ